MWKLGANEYCNVAYVHAYGEIRTKGYNAIYKWVMMRPSMWVDIEDVKYFWQKIEHHLEVYILYFMEKSYESKSLPLLFWANDYSW